MKYTKEDTLLDVMLELEKRIMRNLQVGSFGLVTSVNTIKNTCMVRPIPGDEQGNSSEVQCIYSEHIKLDIKKGAIVIMLMMDKDFRKGLQLALSGSNRIETASSKNLHSDSNAVVIQVFKKVVV